MALILEHKLNASQANSVQPKSIFLKSYEYVNRVKRLKNKEDVTTARGCVPTLRSRPTPTWHSPRAPLHTPPRQPQSKPNRPAPVADLSARGVCTLTPSPAPRPNPKPYPYPCPCPCPCPYPYPYPYPLPTPYPYPYT